MTERIPFKFETEFVKNPYAGLFVVAEGLDGSGNSTQIHKLSRGYFYSLSVGTGVEMKIEKEPTYGPFGAPVNYSLRRHLNVDDRTLQLGFTADRSDHLVGGGLEDYLRQKGSFLLMDRYFASTVAYGFAGGLDIDWLIALQSKFVVPDFMFFIDVPPEICLERIAKRAGGKEFDRYEKLEVLTRTRTGYMLLAEKIPGLIHTIDGNREVSAVTEDILREIKKSPKVRP